MMKAMPLTAGSASRSFLHASRPPAEAPIATIGKPARRWRRGASGIQRGRFALTFVGGFQAFCDFSRRATPYGTGKDQ